MTDNVNLRDLLDVLKKARLIIAVVSILTAAVFAVYTVLFIPEKYTSSVTLYVSNAANSTTGNVNANDLNASQLLANTSVQLLSKEPARTQICESLKKKGYDRISPALLGRYVNITQTLDTELLTIVAITEDPQLSADICNAYADFAPKYLQGIIEAGSFKAVDVAKPDTAPSSPNVLKNAITGLLVGAILTFVTCFLIIMLDTSVKDADDIKKRFNLPVLGEIPTFSVNTKI